MTDQHKTEGAGSEPIAGSNLTQIAEYSETAMAVADLRHRHQGVVYDVTVSKQMTLAKEARAELRTLRVSLEKKRVELKAPILTRGKLLDEEARRLTSQIVELEEPIDIQIKQEEARAEQIKLQKLEDERLRVEAILAQIQTIRDTPASLIGKPAVIIQGQLAKLQKTVLDEAELGADYVTATDALTAAVARVEQLLQAQVDAEAEKKRQAERDADMKAMQDKLDAQQKLIDDAAAAAKAEAERKAAEEAAAEQAKQEAAAAEQRRIEQAERDRVASIRAQIDALKDIPPYAGRLSQLDLRNEIDDLIAQFARPFDFQEFQEEAAEAYADTKAVLEDWLEKRVATDEYEAAQQAGRIAEAARQQIERDRQAAVQKQLDAQAEQLRKDKATAAMKAEAQRLASLGLREAAQAVIVFVKKNCYADRVFDDLAAALANDAALIKPACTKRSAQA